MVIKVKNSTECFVKKRYLNSAENFKMIMNMNSTTTPEAGPSCDNDLVTTFNTKLRAALDSVVPMKLEKVVGKLWKPLSEISRHTSIISPIIL